MTIKKFSAVLQNIHWDIGTFHFIDIPFDVEAVFGRRAGVRVSGTVNTVKFETSLLPRANGEAHYLILNKAIQKAARIRLGDKLIIEIIKEVPAPEMVIPEDLELLLLEMPDIAKIFYEKLLKAQRKYIVEHIESAKKMETRMNRLSKVDELVKKMYSRLKASRKY